MGAFLPEVEAEVKRFAEAKDWDGATTSALKGYGNEVLELLVALHRNETEAADVFALFAEGVWRGLERFGWQSTLRTWLYAVARRSSLRYRRDRTRRSAREAPLPEGSNASILVAQLRSRTASFLRTQGKSRIAALRETLDPDDQTLLMLRVDRDLQWNELAQIMHEGDPLDDEALKRESMRLRKRFQLVKEKLHELARREGLV
jgi:RNA polymerase sigma-70 factor, ECF subfamily